jgi:hypothetical protein
MKALMIDVVNQCYDFLTKLCGPGGAELIETLKQRDEVSEWHDPRGKPSSRGHA